MFPGARQVSGLCTGKPHWSRQRQPSPSLQEQAPTTGESPGTTRARCRSHKSRRTCSGHAEEREVRIIGYSHHSNRAPPNAGRPRDNKVQRSTAPWLRAPVRPRMKWHRPASSGPPGTRRRHADADWNEQTAGAIHQGQSLDSSLLQQHSDVAGFVSEDREIRRVGIERDRREHPDDDAQRHGRVQGRAARVGCAPAGRSLREGCHASHPVYRLASPPNWQGLSREWFSGHKGQVSGGESKASVAAQYLYIEPRALQVLS